jgi:hypothetical protein
VTVTLPATATPLAFPPHTFGVAEMSTAPAVALMGLYEMPMATDFSLPSHAPRRLHITHAAAQALALGHALGVPGGASAQVPGAAGLHT